MHIEDAERVLIQWVREQPPLPTSNYGYDVYLPNVIRWHLGDQYRMSFGPDIDPLWRTFAAAAWELCRRGILRPGVRGFNTQSTPDGSAGAGFSVTPFGSRWAAEATYDDFVPTEPTRFAQMLAPHSERFGPGFHSRAQEAVRCYGAHNFLACCAMCGAAAESILLSAASEKRGEERTLQTYRSAQGRSRVQKDLLAHSPQFLQNEFQNLTILLRYWRDEAAHGRPSLIADNEAYTSLALLL